MNIIEGKIYPIRDNVLVSDMEFGEERTKTGIVVQSLNGKSTGIKARWGRVWAIGPEQKDVNIGEWVCMSHGRWTRGFTVNDNGSEITVRRIDNNDILIVSNEKPNDVFIPE